MLALVGARQAFIWYETDKDLKIYFLVDVVRMVFILRKVSYILVKENLVQENLTVNPLMFCIFSFLDPKFLESRQFEL